MSFPQSIGRDRVPGVPPLQPAVLIGEMTLDAESEHYLWAAWRPGISSGLVVRAAPVDLAMALPLALPEGGRVSVPVSVKEESTVRAELEDGTLLPLSLDGAAAADEVLLPTAGDHHITLVAPEAGGPRIFSLVATPRRAAQGLPALPASLMPKTPDLPVLIEGQPRRRAFGCPFRTCPTVASAVAISEQLSRSMSPTALRWSSSPQPDGHRPS